MKRTAKSAKMKNTGVRKQPRQARSKPDERQGANKPTRVRHSRPERTVQPSPAAAAPRLSKQAAVIALLQRPEGVTVAEIVAATGWQPHTVRGLFSGTLKKKLGLGLGSAQEDRGRVYRVIDAGRTGENARAGG
jgi:hypothetical protein